jgi:hypothetical protein
VKIVFLIVASWAFWPVLSLKAGEPPLVPVTVCEVMKDLAAYDGKVVAVVGRFSFRQYGRWLGEQNCGAKLMLAGQEWPNAFWVTYDPEKAPEPPAVLAVDSVLLAQKLRDVKAGASLGKFRFGSGDYDNWAVVYGRVETRKDLTATVAGELRKNGYGNGQSSPAQLVCHGDAVVIFLNDEATEPASR